MSALGEVLGGMGTYPRAVSLMLRRRGLLIFAVIPVALTVLLLAGAVTGAVYLVNYGIEQWVGGEHWWQGVLRWALFLIVIPGVLVVTYFVFTLVGTLVTIPFNEVLSQRAERSYIALQGAETLKVVAGSAAGEGFVRGTVRASSDGVRITLTILAAQLVLLPLLLVPVAGAALYLAVVSYFNGVDYLDLVLSRHGFTYPEKKAIIRANRPRVLGLGAGMTLCLFVPFTTLLVLPVSAVSGTLLYLDLAREGKLGAAETPTEVQS